MSVHLLRELGKGTYTLIISLKREVYLHVGSLGRLHLIHGIYSYTGSALGPSRHAIYYRVKRHLSFEKRVKWHIDYLTSIKDSHVFGIVAARTDLKYECRIAELLTRSPFAVPIRGFGCTDCRCVSHLHYYPKLTAYQVMGIVRDSYEMLGLNPVVMVFGNSR